MAAAHCAVFALLLALPDAATLSGCSGHGCGERSALEIEGATLSDPNAEEFLAHCKRHSRGYEPGSKEYWLRRALFEQRNKAVKVQNAKLDGLWEAEAGQFADWTEAERRTLRGYRHQAGAFASGGRELPAAAVRARELLRPTHRNATIPKTFDWLHLKVAHYLPDQGQCGSCWAVAAKSVLDAHYEIHVALPTGGPVRNFSAQQIVSCVPNNRSCGGTGGCSGATVELAFDWVLHNGCADDLQVPYHAKDLTETLAKCNSSKLFSLPASSKGLLGGGSSSISQDDVALAGGLAFGMHGYHMLERNKEEPLLMALYRDGPVATSTAAGQWFEYKSGILDSCNKDTIVDHAVTLYGFGEEKAKAEHLFPVLTKGASPSFEPAVRKYWLIRNSWGTSWGEKGFIRMLRFGKENEHCGTDSDNSEGTGCKGDNKTVTVCGMCGFLWDSVVPHFHALPDGTSGGSLAATRSSVEMDHSGKLLRRETLANSAN